MKFSNKKGMELAASTLVILIVSVVMLGLALNITYMSICKAEELAESVDSQQQSRIDKLMASGGEVVVADNTKEAKAAGSILCGTGSSTKTAQFTLGVRNTDNGPNGYSVSLLGPGHSLSSNEIQIKTDTTLDFIDSDRGVKGRVTIAGGTTRYFTVLITVPPGIAYEQIIYTVRVEREGSPTTLHGAQQLYVINR